MAQRKMTVLADVPKVEVGVALIRKGNRILLVYNDRWGAFTLPMSKRRIWANVDDPDRPLEEAWIDAAARSAAEVLGSTCALDPEPIIEVEGERQGDADGILKEYRFQVFKLDVNAGGPSVLGKMVDWLTAEEIIGVQRRPLSVTAIRIVETLRRAKFV